MKFKRHDLVRNKKSGRTYHVLKVNPEGRLFLYKPNHPRIRNADPDNWELVPRLEPLAGSAPTAPDVVEYHLSGEPMEANT